MKYLASGAWIGWVFYGAMERTQGNILVSIVMAIFVPVVILGCCYSRPPKYC